MSHLPGLEILIPAIRENGNGIFEDHGPLVEYPDSVRYPAQIVQIVRAENNGPALLISVNKICIFLS